MKFKYLLICIAISSTLYSQTINDFNSAPGSTYAVVTATLDQSAGGEGIVWTFNTLTATGDINTDAYTMPTVGELATYPGSTEVLTVTMSPSSAENKVLTKDDTNEVSITGATGDQFDLNYNTDNALIGTFPLAFGYSNTNPVAGTVFVAGTPIGDVTENFTGSITSEVDAYGSLTMNDLGGGVFDDNVTRLKITQNLDFTVLGIFPGTATQVTYNYYADNGDLVFRTTAINLSVPGQGIDEDSSLKESLLSSPLGVSKNNAALNQIQIAPNPVGEQLHIRINNSESIQSVVITDITGRTILKEKSSKGSINVSHLNSGIYFATISTDYGTITKQFIKK